MVVLSCRVLAARKFRLNLECMGPEVISLCLQKVCRQIFGAVTVVEAKSCAEGWRWNSPQGAFAYDVSPPWLCFVDGSIEEVVEQKIFEIRIFAIRRGDVFEED